MNSDTRETKASVKDRDDPSVPAQTIADGPLEIDPDTEDDRPGYGWAWNQSLACESHEQQQRERQLAAERAEVHRAAELEAQSRAPNRSARTGESRPSELGCEAGHISDFLQCALDAMHEPALSAADWLARDIDAEQPTAVALLTNPQITLDQARQAKSVFKTMRIVGEKSADRRIGARMYAGAIAAALVRHKQLISSQSPDALRRAFQGLLDDKRMPAALRDLAGMAICALAESNPTMPASDNGPAIRGPETTEFEVTSGRQQAGVAPIPMGRRARRRRSG
jgi:hypothetical protein